MRTMLIAFVAIFVIAFGMDVLLDNVGFSSAERRSGEAVRLD